MFICPSGGGICVEAPNPPGWLVTPAQFEPPLPVPLTISDSVGLNGRNIYSDVISIQRALNMIVSSDGGAIPSLTVDGVCGPLTRGAIQKFQVRHFGWSQADSLVEPGKQTIAKINELLAKVIQKPPGMADLIRAWGLTPEQVVPDIDASFHMARGWVQAARAALPMSTGARLLQKYFLLDQHPNQPGIYGRVSSVFELMHQFFARPGGLWGAQAFQPEPVLSHPGDMIAWCHSGGFFLGGQVVRAKHQITGEVFQMRLDSIFVTFRFILMSREQRAYTIVHELAHFVGRSPDIVDNGAYFHKGTAQALPAAVRPARADFYSMFAFEAATGQDRSPI